MSTISPPAFDLEELGALAFKRLSSTAGSRLVLIHADRRTGRPSTRSALIAPEHRHPTEVLVGRHVQPRHLAAGLLVSCRVRSLDAPGEHRHRGDPDLDDLLEHAASGNAADMLVLADRSGGCTTHIASPGAAPLVLSDPPEGWAADVLARALGRATPAPTESVAMCAESQWLTLLTMVLVAAPGHLRSWDQVYACHPLTDGGAPMAGSLLAMEMAAFQDEMTWESLRRCEFHESLASWPRPPWGLDLVPLDEWFDDGAYCRWIQRDLAPATELLPLVLDGLPERVGRELLDALISVPAGAS